MEVTRQRNTWFIIGLWTLLASVFGILFWKVFGYGQRLLRQPLLKRSAIPANLETFPTVEARALQIAAANLRAGIERRCLLDGQEKLVLCAGLRNFREPWARDLGFASFGLIELGEWQAVKESFEVFLLNQRPSGQFPVKVHSTSVADRYLHSLFGREQPNHAPIKPKYVTAHNTISLDGNAILVIGMLNYAHRTGDAAFMHDNWNALKKAISWLETHGLEADGLLHQAAFADWADSIARRGRVLYTNVLYWKALHDMAHAAATFGQTADQHYFAQRAEYLKQSIDDHFWRPDLGYYVTNKIFDNLSSSGNLLAIVWEMASPAQAHAILDKMNEFGMAAPVPTRTTHRPYPRRFIAIENHLGGIPHYHTSAAWLWLGAWHIIALARMDRLDEAAALLQRMSTVIVRDGAVHEVYAPNGNYLSSFWYTSEAPLTWSAGMVVYAHYVYQRRLAGEPVAHF
ncbi:MAG TPA: GH116 family glycosyl hydrolase [Anaerolineae bacterium]|nr:GH116 family glycosyl hydrolase [Anaerolineae bacterium]HMR63495.1 GH116 family glycosyl hydrolase [Anaerolineae bacterium]